MYELAKVAGFLLAPLTLVVGLALLAGLLLRLGRRAWALRLAGAALVLLWAASTPLVAQALMDGLETQYPARTVAATPAAGAIVVLGGALSGASPPRRPSFELGPAASRVWHAAALYRAGKARWVVAVGGNGPNEAEDQVEAEAIGQMLEVLGVPRSAIRHETLSRNTRENARNALPIIQALGVRRVLLVTSAAHMPRALKTFTKVWGDSGVEIIPASTDVVLTRLSYGPISWIPHAEALETVTIAIKEYAGEVSLAMMQ